MAEALLKLTENTSLRGKAVDGVHYFSVYDFLNFLTGHERGDEHARKVFFDLLNKSEHREEIVAVKHLRLACGWPAAGLRLACGSQTC